MKVDFFLIGAGKCGSSWLAQCLDEHPEITIAKGKEPNFFVNRLSAFDGDRNPYFMSDWRRYGELFQHANPGDVLGDCSVNMLHNVDTAPSMSYDLYPDARLLVILRDPIARTYSHYWHERLYERRRGAPDSFEEAIENRELIFRSSYFEQLKAWQAYFPLSQFHFILDCDVRQDCITTLSQVFAFLDVRTSFVPASATQRINNAAVSRRFFVAYARASAKLQHGPLAFLNRIIGRWGLGRLIRKLGTRQQSYPPMNPHTRERLKTMLREDVEKLQERIGRDLREWMA